MLACIASIAFTACQKDKGTTPTTLSDSLSIVSRSPIVNATNMPINKAITVSFSEPMDANTINNTTFTLKQGNNTIVGVVTYTNLTAAFKPASPLKQNTVYTATISTGVKTLLSVALKTSVSWNFITGDDSVGLIPVYLGAAENYVILAKTAINNSPTSAITGDLGLSPAATSYITGFSLVDATGYATSSQVTGKVFAADMAVPTSNILTGAVNDMITAYNNAAGRSIPDYLELGTGNIGGKTLVPGLYKWTNTVTVPTNLVISGSATDVWIFQIAGDLDVSAGVNITLSGGAKPENIFWQVAGEVVIGTTAHFKGVVLSQTGITLKTGATFSGRALAQTAVIIDASIVTKP